MKLTKTFAIASLSLLALGACAPRPDSIAPVNMSGAFDHLSCSAARTMLSTEQMNLTRLEADQNRAATSDALGVFLIGIPVSSLGGGDQSGLLAATNGKVIALRSRVASC